MCEDCRIFTDRHLILTISLSVVNMFVYIFECYNARLDSNSIIKLCSPQLNNTNTAKSLLCLTHNKSVS